MAREAIALADQVPHLFLLGFEVSLEGGFCGNLGGDAFGDGDADGFERFDFFRIVGDEANGGEAEHFEDCGGEFVLAAVGEVAKLEIGFDRVEALILQFVSLEFSHEADSAAFLVLVEQDTGACVSNGGEGEFKLLAAITPKRVEDVAGEALGVDADDRGFRSGLGRNDVAHNESNCRLDASCGRGDCVVAGLWTGDDAFEPEDTELSPACGEVGIGELANGFEGHDSIIRTEVQGV